MAYIGQGIKNGTFTVLDTSGNTYNGSNVTFSLGTQVGSPAQLLVSHDGVIQKPGTDYSLATGGTQITFSTAPASGASIFITEISGAVGGPINGDLDGAELVLDTDGDTSITADTDDQIDIKIAGADDFAFKANKFEVQTGSNVDMNGTELILDADGDTSITADTDDQIDFKVAGADDLRITANAINVLSGTTLTIDSGATITNSGTANNFGTTTIGGLTDVLMDATNFTDGFLLDPSTNGSAPSTGTLSGANRNIGLGKGVFAALTSGDNNIAIGEGCGAALTSGYTNVIMGMDAGDSITDGYENVLLGGGAGGALTSANNCIAIGRNALDVSQTDTNNIAIGMNALGSANYGGANQNVVIGNSAGDAVNTGDNNTYVGYNAGTTTESSSNNTLIGKDCLSNLGNGGNNTAVGSTLAASSANMEHSITMGYDITGDSNDFKFGKSGNVVHNDFDADANWSRSSDVRKKRNIHSQELGLDFINDLRTVRFQWKPSYEFPKEWDDYDEENNMDTKIIMHGFIAQEVKEALDKHASDEDKKFSGWSEGPDGMQNTSREMFVIPLIKAVQELTAKVKKLEDK